MTESARTGPRELARSLGPVGVWSFALERLSAPRAREVAAEIEELGYGAVWFPESVGSKEVFAHASLLLSATRRVIVASGIANTWARDPVAMANGARTLADAYPDRFLLGMGVSHQPSVARRGGRYERPLEHMRSYLDAMDAARFDGPSPERPAPRVLAALGPRMLELAASRASGAHPYFVPVEHTAVARSVLGVKPLLAVEQTVVLETDASEARRIARAFAVHYLELENYATNLRRLGWSDDDVAGGGSDRLIDSVVAWGDVETIRERVRAHLDAGADHVCVQVRAADDSDPCLSQLRELAPALLDL